MLFCQNTQIAHFMSHIALKINCAFLDRYYKRNQNILIKEQYENYLFPIYITFNQNESVSFHFFPYKKQSGQEINSLFATVILYCKRNNSIIEKREEGWGYISSSNPIVVTFRMKSFSKLLDNEDKDSKYELYFQNYYNYKYLFPFRKFLSTFEKKESNIFWVSLIKSFGILYLKSKERIFSEKIEKCYCEYFSSPSTSTFNNFLFYFHLVAEENPNDLPIDKLLKSSDIGEKHFNYLFKRIFNTNTSMVVNNQDKKFRIEVKGDPIQNTNPPLKKKSKKGQIKPSFTIYLKSCNGMFIFIPEEEFKVSNNDGSYYTINIFSNIFDENDININSHAHIIEIQENQPLSLELDSSGNLSFDTSIENTNQSLYSIISGSNQSREDFIEEEEEPSDDDQNPLDYYNYYFNELNESIPQKSITNGEIRTNPYESSNFLYAFVKGQIPAIYFSAFPFRFYLNETLFLSIPSQLRLAIELMENSPNNLQMTFFDITKIGRKSFILDENDSKFLVFNAFLKEMSLPFFFKIKLGEKNIDDVSKIFIIWDYIESSIGLFRLSHVPTFAFDFEVTNKIVSTRLYPFYIPDEDYETSIEINTVIHMDKNIFSNFALH